MTVPTPLEPPLAEPPAPGSVETQRLGALAALVCASRRGAVWLVGQAAPEGLQELFGRAVATSAPVLVTAGTDGVGAFLGLPLSLGGQVVGAIGVWADEPRDWTGPDLDALGLVAELATSELEHAAEVGDYEAIRARYALSIEAAGIGSFEWDLVTDELTFDDAFLTLFDQERGERRSTARAVGRRMHPDDATKVMDQLKQAIDGAGAFAAEYRIVLDDGSVRWVASRGRTLAGPDGQATRLLGAVYEITDAHESASRVARVLDSMSAAFLSIDRSWRIIYVNRAAVTLFGRPESELVGTPLREIDPRAARDELQTPLTEAIEHGGVFETYHPAPVDRWFETRAWPSPDGASLSITDITARRRSQLAAERADARTRLLARVITQLTAARDPDEALARLAKVVVPELVDWCMLSLEQGRAVTGVGYWHADPERRHLVERYAQLRRDGLTEESRASREIVAAREVVQGPGARDLITKAVGPGEAQELMRQLAPGAVMLLPLQVQGERIGAFALLRDVGRPEFDDEDLQTGHAVADRAALTFESSRLYEEQRLLAEQLQRSLLTPAPIRPGMAVAVRYQPASQEAQVGGDWYDAFPQPNGATVLVIGDVIGHDSVAAGAMGQVRGLLRGIGYTSESGPAELLTRLDAAMHGLEVGTTASAVVARLEVPADGSSTRWLRWSNAGHPPPVTVSPSGEVSLLVSEPADLLLGVDRHTSREERVVPLAAGSTVMLYTDGLVERRGQSLDEGLTRLQELLGELGSLPLEELCDQVLRRLAPDRPDDDVAIVAVRITP